MVFVEINEDHVALARIIGIAQNDMRLVEFVGDMSPYKFMLAKLEWLWEAYRPEGKGRVWIGIPEGYALSGGVPAGEAVL